jgi:hypothetical protein
MVCSVGDAPLRKPITGIGCTREMLRKQRVCWEVWEGFWEGNRGSWGVTKRAKINFARAATPLDRRQLST